MEDAIHQAEDCQLIKELESRGYTVLDSIEYAQLTMYLEELILQTYN